MKRQQSPSMNKMQIPQSDLDPLQIHELIVEQQLFLPVITSQSQQPKAVSLIFKIMRDKNEQMILIYVLSEADLYFLYKFQLTYEAMVTLNSHFKLSFKKMADFVEFMKASLDDIQNHEKEGLLQIGEEGEAELLIKRVVAGKVHIVMSLLGKQQLQQVIRSQVAYRYGALRERIHRKQQRIQYLRQIVKQKYPHLLKNLKQI